MGKLIAYGNEITNVFQLIGTLENDITKSIAWALCQCPVFLGNIVKEILTMNIDINEVRIKYQVSEKDKGITDLEITDDDLFYIIVEAKRGWILPGKEQLEMYSQRRMLIQNPAQQKIIVSMSECSTVYANTYLPLDVNGIPVRHLPWKRIHEIANESRVGSSIAQRSLLNELMQYLGGIMTMQTKESNWVYVVSLGSGKPDDCVLTWIEIVQKHMRYFHPIGGKAGWPKEPPNYIAFRYGGQLQSIHHIEDYVVTKNLHDEISEMPDRECEEDHFIYKLGPAIIPSKVVKMGNIYASGRVWAMLDALLTADTIDEARNISKQRMQQ